MVWLRIYTKENGWTKLPNRMLIDSRRAVLSAKCLLYSECFLGTASSWRCRPSLLFLFNQTDVDIWLANTFDGITYYEWFSGRKVNWCVLLFWMASSMCLSCACLLISKGRKLPKHHQCCLLQTQTHAYINSYLSQFHPRVAQTDGVKRTSHE